MLTAARSIFRYRNLLLTLTGRELKARYRGSVLGYLWSLVNPVLLLGVYTFVFSFVFQPRDESVSPYALFLITGLFPWIWFQTSLVEATASLLANSGLIRKATFPAEILPIVPVLANLVHLALALPVIAAAFGAFHWQGYPVGGLVGLLLPAITLVQLPMVAGLALGLSALNAHFKDVKDILNNILTLLFFLTPILYRLPTLAEYPWIQWVVRLNPLTPFTSAYQLAVFDNQLPGVGLWLAMAAVSLVCWSIGAAVFDRLRETLVEAV
ncbi:MAG: ABC transporter permease [Thermoanaerobaculia bacterium]|nr:ABC transporter permease [Thermoanaerobaculia bacterium]